MRPGFLPSAAPPCVFERLIAAVFQEDDARFFIHRENLGNPDADLPKMRAHVDEGERLFREGLGHDHADRAWPRAACVGEADVVARRGVALKRCERRNPGAEIILRQCFQAFVRLRVPGEALFHAGLGLMCDTRDFMARAASASVSA